MIIGYINGQSLQLHHGRVVEKTINYLTAEFHFMTNEWDGFDKYAHFVNGEKHYKIKLTNNQVKKSDHLNLTAGVWKVYLHGVLSTEVVTTNQCELTVEVTGDVSGGEGTDDIVQEAIKRAQEEYRNELETSLETATGKNYDGKTWEELSEAVKEIPILTPEKQEDIDGLALVRFAVENIVLGRTAQYSLKTHSLFSVAPVDENNAEIDFALPYFNTSRAYWEYTPTTWGARQNYFSPRLKEIGLDCTSAVNFSESKTLSIFEYFKKLKLTNVSCSLHYGFNGCTQLQTLEIYGKNGVIAPISMEKTFANCKELSEILGDEFDMSGVTNASSAFANCYKLRHIRFKPFTIATSLYFGDCLTLHLSGSTDYDSLISILNGITLDREVAKNITLTFSGAITDFTTDGGFWSCNVWFQDDGTYTLEEGNSVFAEPESLYSAFISKGVTIAIV